jgi:pimeloyl-ACP methyl ester carboxylesterase
LKKGMEKFPPAVEVEAGGFRISCLLQRGGVESIVFIHGLGACKDSFRGGLGRETLGSFTLLAPDLVGFGESQKPADFSYSMKDHARILAGVVDHFGIETFHVVAHSMGGIVGIELCEMLPGRVRSFTNVEGNLTLEDCFFSRRVIEMSEEEFTREGFDLFKRMLELESEKAGSESLQGYAAMLSKAGAAGVYKSSLSTVRESDSGNLVERFGRLPLYACHVYGEKNKGHFPAEKLLEERGVPIFYVAESGHAPMDENPDEFYDLVKKVTVRAGEN